MFVRPGVALHIYLPDRVVDLENRLVRSGTGDEPLTELEQRLLSYLVSRDESPVSRDELLAQVWELPPTVQTRCVDTAIRRLRRKLEPDPRKPHHLLKVHGLGYRFVAMSPEAVASPIHPQRTDLPPDPRLVGREEILQKIVARLGQGPVLTVVGPPGAGLSSLAIAALHRGGGRFSGGVWVGGADPGLGALWFRDDDSPVAAEAHQLYTGAPTGLPGEEILVVPALEEAFRRELLPDHAALRAEIGGLAGTLHRLRALDQAGLTPTTADVRPSRQVPPDTVAALQAFRLRGGAAGELVRAGWLQLDSHRPILPFTVGCQLPEITSEQRLEQARYLVTWGAQAAASAVAPRHAEVVGCVDWCAGHAPDLATELLLAFEDYVRASVGIPDQIRWLNRVVAGDITPRGRCRALRLRAEARRKALRLDEALADVEEALSLVEGLEGERGALLYSKATTLHTRGDWDQAIAAYALAAAHLDRLDPKKAINIRCEAARLTFREGRIKEGIEAARQALRLAGQAELPWSVAHCEAVLGRLLSLLGWHWESVPRLRSAASHFREADDGAELGHTLFKLGDALLDVGELEAAETAFREGFQLAMERRLGVLDGQCLGGIGVVRLLAGDLEEARSQLEASIRALEDVGQSSRTIPSLGWLAVVYHRMGERALVDGVLKRGADLEESDEPTFGAVLLALCGRGDAAAVVAAGPPDACATGLRLRVAFRALSH